MQLRQLTPYTLLRRIDRHRCAESAGQIPPSSRRIDPRDVSQTAIRKTGDCRQTYRATTEYGNGIRGGRLKLFSGMHTNSHWLGQRRHIQRHSVRHDEQPATGGRFAHQHRLGQAALGRPVADPAEIVVSRMNHHPLPHHDITDLGADLGHHTGQFMAEGHWLAVWTRQPAHPDVAEIAATDTAGMDLDNCIARSARGCRHTVQRNHPRGMDAGLLNGGRRHRFRTVANRKDTHMVINLDDLADPVLTDAQRQILDYTEAREVVLDADQMLQEAIAQAGCDDLADADGFHGRLMAHIEAIEADTGLRQLSRGTLRSRIVRLLRNRLSLTDLLKRYPEIARIEVEKPLIVVGMPRSGTTHLVNLIAQDPRRRALPYWESQEPIPAPGQGSGVGGSDPRFLRAKSEHDALMASTPYVAAMHDRFPEAIEEEVEVQDLDLSSYVLEWHARVPAWRDFYLSLDQNHHYAYLKTVLQALTFFRGPRTWVLKSPQHAEQLGPLMSTFPDATVAFTHRDPVAVIQSAITMMAYSDRLRRHKIDTGWLLDYWSDRIHRLLSACVRDRALIPAERSIDISFQHLNGNEMPVLEEFYSRAGLDIPANIAGRFQGYIDANRRGAKGRIPYDLRGHFGIEPADLRSRFGFYLDRFDIHPEDRECQ